jgi:hypothetical protein
MSDMHLLIEVCADELERVEECLQRCILNVGAAIMRFKRLANDV